MSEHRTHHPRVLVPRLPYEAPELPGPGRCSASERVRVIRPGEWALLAAAGFFLAGRVAVWAAGRWPVL